MSECLLIDRLEDLRWGNHPTCPRCESDDVYYMRSVGGGRNRDMRWRCRSCERMYTVRTGTIFEETRVPLSVWVAVVERAANGGVYPLMVAREFGVSYKTALWMIKRLKEALSDGEAEAA